ncbi:MAG: aldehyde dehydrogenase family protein [Candidatus Cloacimonadota bacterium]|nr:aldehyde dehydrogenase family protein [Candidatus Cloacimonadota bacterium]
MKEYPIYLGNERIYSSNKTEILSPYKNKIVGIINMADSEHIERAVELAKHAFQKTKKMPAFKRSEILMNIAKEISEDRKEIATTLALECGKNIKFAKGEVLRAIQTFTIAAEESKRIQGEFFGLDAVSQGKEKSAIVKRFPIGPILGITPFNYPLNLVAHKVAPAIAVGNPIIIKPSSLAPLTSITLAEIVAKYAPKGMLSVLPCKGSQIEKAVINPDIKMVSFTGSPVVGWKLKQMCGKKRICLELGGNAGAILDKDCDIDSALSACVIGAFANAGQVCIHTQKIFVHENIYDNFITQFVKKSEKIKNGNPLDQNVFLNPMITEEEAIRAEDWINEAVNSGAKILCGGNRKDNFLDATVITDTKREMKVEYKEVFAPIVIVKKFSKFTDAVEMINDTEYGLQAGIFSNNMKNIMYAFENIDVGGVIINNTPTFRVDQMPYGGIKNSGFGREGLRYSIEEMTERKLMVL